VNPDLVLADVKGSLNFKGITMILGSIKSYTLIYLWINDMMSFCVKIIQCWGSGCGIR
jgi:hypothetical protein